MRIAVRKTAAVISLAFLVKVGVGCGTGGSARLDSLSWNTPAIAKQPVSHAAVAGQTTTFEVLAKELGPLHYQWFKNGTEVVGATSARYTTPPTTIDDDSSEFRVVVRSWGKSLTSDRATLRVLASARDETVSFPVKVSSDGRYLVDQSNKPLRIQGEAAWSLAANLKYDEVEIYLSDRKAKGFNTILMELMEHKYAAGGKGSNFSGVPTNRNGALPFTGKAGGGTYEGTWGTADFSTPNEKYFAFADSVIDLAAQKGMLVDLAPMFLGFDGRNAGWWADLTNSVNTQAVAYTFGLYIGKRYRDRKNIIWVIGGDYFPPPGSEGEVRLLKFLEGIKAAGANQLWSGDWSASSLSTDEPAFEPLMDVNAVYTYGVLGHDGATYEEANAAYAQFPHRPAYLKETGYEDEGRLPGQGKPASVRMYEYYAILGGCTAGGFFGNRDIWNFATDHWWYDPANFGHGPWAKAMESPGTFDFLLLGRLLDSVPWYNLVPSERPGAKRKLVTRGEGNHGTTDYVVAAATSDGKVLLAYVPPTRRATLDITVDMSALTGPSRGRWFDPTSGRYTDVPDGPFPNIATQTFTTPGMNWRGDSDWVLLLRVE